MNIRIVAAIATLTVVTTSGGCSGMRNFLFGRGAACAVGPTAGPVYGVPGLLPGLERGCGWEPGCGHELGCGYEPACGYERAPHRPFAGLRGGCGLLGGRGTCAGTPACGCGTAPGYPQGHGQYDAYSGSVQDPYGYSGAVVGSEIVGDSFGGYPGVVYPGATYPGGVIGDSWGARGERIIGETPMTVQP